jgi:hypothetical protein
MPDFGAFVLPIVIITLNAYLLGSIARDIENYFIEIELQNAGSLLFVLGLLSTITFVIIFAWFGYLLFLKPGG